jgi:predicted DNA-binding WGR domain protein
MNKTTRHFEFKDDNSSKFWEITQTFNTVTVRYGKTGTNGQTQEKALADTAAAGKHVAKLIAEKLGKGYVEQGNAPVIGADAQAAPELPVEKALKPGADSETQKVSAKAAKAQPAKSAKPKNPAQDLEAAPECLMALLDKDDATNRLLAKHPRASAELLEKLSHSSDQATRRAVAGNPNTPPQIYVRLGQQFPKEFLANPMLDLLLMENPVLMVEVPEALLIRLLKQADCPTSLLAWAAGHPEAKVQLAVAMNAQAPEHALIKLRLSEHAAVLESVDAKSQSVSDQDPEKAFDHAVRERLASMTHAELDEAWSSGDIGLPQWSVLPLTFRLAKATNSDALSPEAIARVLRDTDRTLSDIRAVLPKYQYWGEVANSLATPGSVKVELLEAMSKDTVTNVRREVAESTFAPAHVLENLSKDSDYMVRYSVGRNPATPKIVLDTLSKDADISVRANVGSNCSSPVAVLEALANDSHSFVQRRVSLNPSTPNDVKCRLLEHLSNDQDVEIRREVAANTAAPAHVLAALGKDSESQVRREVAKNSIVPRGLLELLAEDYDPGVLAAVSLNPMTPVHSLEVLSRDLGDLIRHNVSANPSTPVHILELLAVDSDGGVRRGVAGNPSTPVTLLEKLATDRDSTVKTAVVGNPNTPLSALLKLLAAAKTLDMRLALADQANRSPKVVSALWSDTDEDRRRDVRSRVIRCKRLTQETLAEMVTWAERESDLTALLEHPNLSDKSVESIAGKLLATPATDSAWYQGELAKATSELRKAAQEKTVLFYPGKDPAKAVLAKRPMATVMALCAGAVIEPSRLVKVVGSTDWLIRAAVARNRGTPPNLIKKLSADAHPLVAALARKAHVGAAESTTADPSSPKHARTRKVANKEIAA